jgi:hypothetical protein
MQNFSKAATIYFSKIDNQSDPEFQVFKKDLIRELESFFHKVNSIHHSNMKDSIKQSILQDLFNLQYSYFYSVFSAQPSLIFTSFSNKNVRSFYIDNYSFLVNILSTKFSRLSSI